MSDVQTLELGPEDCALILRSTGKAETLIPKMDDETAPVSDAALLIVACGAAVLDPKMAEILYDYMAGLLEQAESGENSQSN